MSQVIRRSEIDRRRGRRNKIRKLRARMARAKNQIERQHLIAKLLKISPFYPVHTLSEKGVPMKQAA